MFLGVFLVGSVLSASLAARFTRPVRRLDAGIRRLGEGELEVEVDVNGGGEMGRLGRAFNEMARRLRLNRERERELTRREKLSSLGRLASGVAHDVRNPLHSIGLTLQHLQETGRPADPGRAEEFDRSLAIIREEIGRLDRLVDNFLRFARSSPRPREELDLALLLRETVRLVEKQAERLEIRLEVVVEGEPRRVLADAEAIRSALLNLVLNGFEAMPRGGTLTLSLREAGGEVQVEVADTGEGIAEEDREKVFDFAYTTRDGGHGLGLAMVHQAVVEGHGGRVSLESAPGEGTRVLLAFPPEAGEEPS
jgi:signal transduction histidine kinase